MLNHRNGCVAISTSGMSIEIYSGILDALLQRPRAAELAYPYPDHIAGVQQPDSFRYQRILSESEDLFAHEETVLSAALKQMLVQLLAELFGLRAIDTSSWKKKINTKQ